MFAFIVNFIIRTTVHLFVHSFFRHPADRPSLPQVRVAVVSPASPVSQESGVRKETRAPRDSLCRAPQDGQVLRVVRVHQGPPALQAFPPEEATASAESPDVPACREREVTRERRVRKVGQNLPISPQ